MPSSAVGETHQLTPPSPDPSGSDSRGVPGDAAQVTHDVPCSPPALWSSPSCLGCRSRC